VESGVKYVKRNALAGRTFDTFAALEQHLSMWIAEADARVHGTTHERPIAFCATSRPRCARSRRARCRGASTASVDASRRTRSSTSTPSATVSRVSSYAITSRWPWMSTPCGCFTTQLVATHPRSREPYARVLDPAHVAGLWRVAPDITPGAVASLAPLGRSLADYAAIVGGAQ
jgi:hypothetical protein